MKKERGLTLISLVITIVLIMILVGVTAYYATPVIQNTQLQNLNTNMLLIQAKTKTIGENAKFNNNTGMYMGTKINADNANEEITELINKGIINVEGNFYLLSKRNLEEIGLSNINYDSGYVVDYDTDEIIYVKGFEYEKKMYYRLSEMKLIKIDM